MNSQTVPPAARREFEWLKALAIVLPLLFAYGPAMRAGFIWDDDSHFTQNPLMTGPGGLARLWTDLHFYYPLTSTTWWFLRRLWGLAPVPYHLLNIALHGINAILLWKLLARLRIPGAWLGGAVFALHPVNVQSVAWATELKNCQSGLFYLLSLHAWERFDERRGGKWWLVAFFCFMAAVLSKTSTVTLPIALVAIHLWRRRPLDRRAAAAWLPFPALAAAAGLMTVVFHGPLVRGSDWDLSFPARLALAGRCFWFYLGKLAWPANLSFVYPRWSVDEGAFFAWLPLLALAILFLGLWAFRRRGSRAALLALAYFMGSLAPVLNFFRMYYARYSFVADHWQYLAAMGGIAWGIGSATWLLHRWRDERRRLLAGIVLSTALLGLLAGMTRLQTRVYENSETLWFDVLAHNPTAAIAYNNLAFVYCDRQDYAMAEAALRKGLASNPENSELLTILGGVLVFRGRPGDALAPLELALKQSPGDAEILNNLGAALAGVGRTDEAIARFREAVAADPAYPEAQANLAKNLAATGHRGEALDVLNGALVRLPDSPILRATLHAIEGMGQTPPLMP